MKRTLIGLLAILLTAGMVTAAPRGPRQKGVEGNRGPHGALMFRLVASVRTELNLSAEQNTQLDQLLNDVKAFIETERDSFRDRGDSMMEQFVSEDFDAASIHADREKRREELRARAQSFMIGKTQALHDLLTLEQREKLAEIMDEKREEMRGKRPRRGSRGGRY